MILFGRVFRHSQSYREDVIILNRLTDLLNLKGRVSPMEPSQPRNIQYNKYNTNFMQESIPILVTHQIHQDSIFNKISPSILRQVRNKRHPTAPKLRPNPNHNPSIHKHQTLDPDIASTRTRRISSSAASRRFPKDFFKEEISLNPIKTSKIKHKQHNVPMIDTFSRKNFIAAQGEYLQIDQEPN